MPISSRFFFAIFLVMSVSCQSFAQLNWLRSSGAIGYEDVVATDYQVASGVVAAGHFNTPFYMGVFPFNTAGLSDVFVISYLPDGTFNWARSLGGTGDERASAIKASSNGDVLVTGTFTQSFQAGNTLLTCQGQRDVFVIRLNTTGQITAAFSFGGPGNEEVGDIDMDPNGNILVVGTYRGIAQFGTQSVISSFNPVSQSPGADPYILSFSATGGLNWFKTGQSSLNDAGLQIEADPTGDIYVAGQCSDTIQFTQLYPNAANNAIWLLKLNNSGSEQWFRSIGGSSKSILRGLEVSTTGSIYLGGEAGNSCLFNGPVNSVLSTPYSNAVFIAAYTPGGTVQWISSEGSDSYLDAGAMGVDNNGRVWLGGKFRCTLTSLSVDYGTGRFRSTGFNDVWLAAFDQYGNRVFAQQLGGQGDEDLMAMANGGGEMILAGHYDRRIIIPAGKNFNLYDGASVLTGITTGLICADSSHGRFVVKQGGGGTDFFIGACIDTTRDAYDFFGRQQIDCTFPPSEICIGPGSDQICSGDTISGCGIVRLSAATNTSAGSAGDTLATAGPFYIYSWSDGSATPGISASNDGWFTVTVSSEDGCYSGTATAYADVHPVPPPPFITDNLGVNTGAFLTQPVRTCVPDTIEISASNTGGLVYYWEVNGNIISDSVYTWPATDADSFAVNLIVSNTFGCMASNSVFVAADSLLTPVAPAIFAEVPDTLSACAGGSVQLWISDTLTDPTGQKPCNLSGFSFFWTSVPSTNIIYTCAGGQSISLLVLQSGLYTLTCTMLRSTLCGGTDSFTLTKSVYVTFYPPVAVQPGIAGVNSTDIICPDEFKTLEASGGYFYSWSGPGVQMPYNDSVLVVTGPGTYCVIVTDSSTNGCIGSAMSCATLTSPPIPVVSASASLLCPDDSVMVTASGGVYYDWYGPSGLLSDSGSVIYGNEGGFYYAYAHDTSGCTLVSNPVEIQQYSTPSVFAQPIPVICNGTPVSLHVSANTGSIINWLPPLSGSAPEQQITTPGVFQCNVVSCGITTVASIEISGETLQAEVIPAGPLTICDNDTLLLHANGGFSVYQWIPGQENGNTLPVHSSGAYAVFVISASGCIDTSASVLINTIPAPAPPVITMPDTVCYGEDVSLSAVATAGVFSWHGPDGFTSSQLTLLLPGVQMENSGWYTATIEDGQCESTSAQYLTVQEPVEPSIQIAGDLCLGQNVQMGLNDSVTGLLSWTLPDGTIRNDIALSLGPLNENNNGLYVVRQNLNGCSGIDSLILEITDCTILLPDIFSPNGDDINDWFVPVTGQGSILTLTIYNRWGATVFSGDEKGWDGRNTQGQEVPEGTYFYIVLLKDKQTRQGTLMLIR